MRIFRARVYAANSAGGGDEGVIGDESIMAQSGGLVDGGGEAGGTDAEPSLCAGREAWLWLGSGALLLVTPVTRLLFPLLLFARTNMALLVLRSGVRSVKRISERDATRSREGRALGALLALEVDATDEVVEEAAEDETRLGAFERVVDCFLVAFSLGYLGLSSCGADVCGG